jgi:hypothetical protein
MSNPDDYSERLFRHRVTELSKEFAPVRTCPLCSCPTTRQRVKLADYERLVGMAVRGNKAAFFTLRRIHELPERRNAPVCGGCLLHFPAPTIVVPL